MEYDIKKDSKPEETIKRIKQILNDLNIETNILNVIKGENYYSCRINIEKTNNTGANGKGISEVNALASCYAELIERLQTQYLFKFKNESYIENIDEKVVLFENYNDLIIENKKSYLNIDSKLIKKIVSLNSILKTKKKECKKFISLVPFVEYKTKKIKYLSTSLLDIIQGSNGLASGNTHEEACVQGLSEIIERYCAKEIFLKKLKLPTVPKKYYEKYEKIISLIDEIETLGYKITIKDASLNKKFPTICCIVENLNHQNEICIKFGTHPYFPIALERCLTEFIQGSDEKFKEKIKFKIKTKNITLENIILNEFLTKTLFKKSNKHIQNFLSNGKDWEFNKKTYLFNEKITNKKLFNKFARNILKYADDIYIRNSSFLDFPTVRIYIPKFSSPYVLNLNFFENWKNVCEWENYVENKIKLENFSLKNLMNACKFIVQQDLETQEDTCNFGQMGAKYLGFYCAIVLNDKKEIKRFLRKILNYHSEKDGANNENKVLRLYQTFGKYFKLKWKNLDSENVKEKIEKQFGKELYKRIIHILNVVNEKAIFESLYSKENSKETDYIKFLQKQIGEICKNNPPNQNEIKNIIQKPNFFEKLFIS